MSVLVVRVQEIGWKARRIVEDASTALVVAALSRSVYLEIRREIVWLGPRDATLHGRAIVASELPAVADGAPIDVSFALAAARPWRPMPPPPIRLDVLAPEARRLAATIERLGRPDGFGTLLAGRRPSFPLDRATEDARRFLDACAGDDPAGALGMADRLVGLGPGLTPAGDDLIGGALFAKTLLATDASPWRPAAEAIRALARARTHRISAMLLGDLLDGEGHAPLHDLAAALARADAAAADTAAASVIRLGHSSGWDMLTGCLGALGALSR